MVDLRDELHLDGLERIGIGDDNVLRVLLTTLITGKRCCKEGYGAMVGKEGTHNCKVTAIIRSILWTIKGAAKMKRRVVDEINVDFRRLVVLAIWRAQQIRKNLQRN
jgi:hypothetical protein